MQSDTNPPAKHQREIPQGQPEQAIQTQMDPLRNLTVNPFGDKKYYGKQNRPLKLSLCPFTLLWPTLAAIL
jgi:hypothetical protein